MSKQKVLIADGEPIVEPEPEKLRKLDLLFTKQGRKLIERAIMLYRGWRGDTSDSDPASDGDALVGICLQSLDRQKGAKDV